MPLSFINSIDQIIDLYASLTLLVRPQVTSRIAFDRDDDVVIGTVIAAKTDDIVSGKSHLLNL